MTTINDDKRTQLLRDGFCKFGGVLSPETVAALGAACNRMLDALPPEQAQKLRAQGSLLHTTGDPIFADLVTDPAALQALASLGFAPDLLGRLRHQQARPQPAPLLALRLVRLGGRL